MYKPISHYGAVGDLRTVALIASGSVDWLCLPDLDSPSVFAALLDADSGGCFAVRPEGPFDAQARYLEDTNVLETHFRCRTGRAVLTDFMPLREGGPDHPDGGGRAPGPVLWRKFEVLRGEMEVLCRFAPRFDYARDDVRIEEVERGVLARGQSSGLACGLYTRREMVGVGPDEAEGRWRLASGEEVWLALGWGEERVSRRPEDGEAALEETARFWSGWLETGETGREVDFGSFAPMVRRSALALKMLFRHPDGSIAAAATTSLPEVIGGGRNWDYRYTWVRDTSFTLRTLFNLGHVVETEAFLRWIEKRIRRQGGGGAESMQIMYGLRGEADLPERELDHLDGYKGSRPVRVGNEAAGQLQLDIYGELLDAAMLLSDYVGKIDEDLWPFLRSLCDHVTSAWKRPDYGLWEVRGGPRHFVHSKVMCWVALDRGLAIAERYGFPHDRAAWERALWDIKFEVLDKGYDPDKGAFRMHYGTGALDAASLLIPLVGFLPFSDERVRSNIEAVRRELASDGFVYRYRAGDGLEGEEGAFLLCSCWLADCLVELGDLEKARHVLNQVAQAANPLGLFSEEYCLTFREQLGNFPQAFTHLGFVDSTRRLRLAETRRKTAAPEREPEERAEAGEDIVSWLLAPKAVLNRADSPPGERCDPLELARELRRTMNLLRGAFFEAEGMRVAYERMPGSQPYQRLQDLSRRLRGLDPADLRSRDERRAFWINLYNVLVIHGVVALGVRDTVREARNFFRRVRYQVGGMEFSPDHIEHGVLRANRRPPRGPRAVFSDADPRLEQCVGEVDPRIHFALVCASRSCPPVEAYEPDSLDKQLDAAARAFAGGGGVVVDPGRGEASLSRVFLWYRRDFGENEADVLRFMAPYVADGEEADFLRDHADDCAVRYQEYDWRLNR
ncbi:glycoside hydrolase family 15 protein [Desulfohalovibrio reitneri]|uniref:glycoside hydrolase family 15 protein n=1 Tax=Desulfohalovibrio reitneri TaxID=1307759 RepID=UPI0004A6B63B|nr:glycoside hydrolase family 15 protein [Desulfohalovibrio reitneri]